MKAFDDHIPVTHRAATIAFVAALALATTPARAQDAGADAPLLRLEDAVEAAQRQNHQLAITALTVEAADERVSAQRTRRLPHLQLDGFGGRLLNSPEITVPAGSLGTLPPLGAIPPTETSLEGSSQWLAAGIASVGQPLTQQYRIGLGIEALRLDREIASAELRREKQRTAAEVRTTYYEISANEAGIAAIRDLVRAIEEVDDLTTRYRAEEVVLRSEALEVKARLARERQRLTAAENAVATQREHLNQLMGRDVATPFRVSTPSELASRASALPLDAARQLALTSRPELLKASLRVSQAETARRLARADWIPDVTLAASYARTGHSGDVSVLPDEVATVGLVLSWEPWDWGRRKRETAARAHEIAAAKEGRQETAEQIAVEVGHRWRELNDATVLLAATRVSVDAAQAYLEDTKNLYREDARKLFDVLEAEARASRARSDFTDALAGYWSATAELERAIGHEE
jgi:outer membrane protein TolC